MQLGDIGDNFLSHAPRQPNLLYAFKFSKEAGEVNNRITLDDLPPGTAPVCGQ
jgi:hypothetical protein